MKISKYLAEHHLISCLLLSHLVFVSIFMAREYGGLQWLELYSYDIMMEARPATKPDKRIVVITETEQDLRQFGHPLPDAVFVDIIEKLMAANVRVIGIDKYRDMPVPPGSAALDQILSSNDRVVWISLFGKGGNKRIKAPEVIEQAHIAGLLAASIGFNDLPVDQDKVSRRGMLFIDDGREFFTSFPLMIVMRYLADEEIYPEADIDNPDYFRFGKTTFPPLASDGGPYVDGDAQGYQFLIDYRGMPGKFQRYTLSDLMSDKIPEDALKDRIIFFGSSAESLGDVVFTPFNRSDQTVLQTLGIELHAYIANQILALAEGKTQLMRSITQQQKYIWIWFWCVLGGLISLYFQALSKFVLIMTLSISTLIFICYYAFTLMWWIPVVPSFIGLLIAGAITTAYISSQEKAQRQMLMHLFSRHVSSDVAEDIWNNRDAFLENGRPRSQRLVATVMFTDIKGFTAISEKMEPYKLMAWLNDYLEKMSQVVSLHNGVVNKFIGDAVMAIFGIPLARTTVQEQQQDAINAVNCALAMRQQLNQWNVEQRAKDDGVEIAMRIGIHSGDLIAGSVGSQERLEYTVIGDTVNTAARLEGYAKQILTDQCCRILISEKTKDMIAGNYTLSKVGDLSLKGKKEKVTVYHVD